LTLLKYVIQTKWAPQPRGPLCFAHAAQSIATPLNFVDADASSAKASTKHLESRLEVIQAHAF